MPKPMTLSEVRAIREIYAREKCVLRTAIAVGRSEHTVRRYLSEESEAREKLRMRTRYEKDRQNPKWVARSRAKGREYKRRIRAEGGDAT